MAFILTTVNTVTFDDMGGLKYTHPTVSFDLSTVATASEIAESADVQAAITGGDMTVVDASGNPITDASLAAPGLDANAIHDNVESEITVINEKTVPTAMDVMLINDVADSDAPKKVLLGNLPTHVTAQVVVVAISGGDYTSVKSACDAIVDSAIGKPYTVLVRAGVYTEAPFTVPVYTYLQVDRGARLDTSNNSANFITLSNQSVVSGGQYTGPTTSGAGMYVNGGLATAKVENCIFLAGKIAINATAASTRLVVEECKFMPSVEVGLQADTSGRIDCANVLSFAGTTSFFASGGTVWVHNSGAEGSTNGVYTNAGGSLNCTGLTLDGCTNAVRTGTSGTNDIHGMAIVVRNSVTYDVYQETAGSTIHLATANLLSDKFSMADWSDVDMDYSDEKEGDEGWSIVRELHVGVAEEGREAVFGEGDSYTRGMKVLKTDGDATSTTDGSNPVDVSTAAQSASGITFGFKGVTANHTILVGSELSDGSDVLKHWGLRIKNTTAAVEVTPLSFVFEIWDGAAWVAVGHMATDAGLFHRFGDAVFIRANNNEHVRFGIKSTTTWGKKTIDGSNLYWSRIRIATTVTTTPLFQQFKLSTSRSEINADGTATMHGAARFKNTLFTGGNIFGESGGVVATTLAVGAGVLPVAWDHEMLNNKLNAAGDAIYMQLGLPRGIDTSHPLDFRVVYVVTAGGTTSDLIFSIKLAEVAGNTVADPAGGITPVARALGNTATVIATDGQSITSAAVDTSTVDNKVRSADFNGFDISSFYEGDIVFWRFELDSGAADISVLSVEVSGVKWTLGEKL